MSSIKLSPNASGTGAFTIAAPNSNTDRTLTLPDASGTLLTNSGTEAGAFSTLSVNSNNISAVNSLGFRNRILNGGMVIDQRNAGASVTTSVLQGTTYTLDRWAYYSDVASKRTIQQVSTAPAGFNNSLKVTVIATDVTGPQQLIRQAIEGFNTADLGWGTAAAQAATLSFWVRSSVTGQMGGSIQNSASNRSYPFAYSINTADTWEYKTVAITGDTSGTWLTTNGVGLSLIFENGLGYQKATAGAWAAQNSSSSTGSVNLCATNGATWYITGVQLEAGSVATPFERRDYGRELMMCQRYYWKLKQSDTSNQFTFGVGAVGSAKDTFFIVNNPVQMRSAPTATQSGTVNINYNASAYAKTAIGGQYAGTITTRITWNDASLVAGGATWFDFASGAYIEFSSEL